MVALWILCVLLLEAGLVACVVSDDDFDIVREDIYTLRSKLRTERNLRLKMENRLEVLEEQMQKERHDNGGDGNRAETLDTLIRDMNVERQRRIDMEEVVFTLQAEIAT